MVKVGDEVFMRGKIIKIDGRKDVYRPYYFRSYFGAECWVEESQVELANKTYTQGLADAWELGKRFAYGDLSNPKKRRDIFGDTGLFACMNLKGGAEEALAKIEAYEREKEIKVGDVVEAWSGAKGVVVAILTDGTLNIVYESGLFGVACSKDCCTKTGKHIDIEAVLRQIGE